MNNAINQVILTDVAAASGQRHKAADTESGEFGEMLSEAMQTTEETQSDEAAPEMQPEETEEQSLTGEEGEQEYGMQLAAVMAQTIIQINPDASQTEPDTEEAAQETVTGITEAINPQAAATENVQPLTGGVTALREQNTSIQEPHEKFAASGGTRETTAAEARETAETTKTQHQPGKDAPVLSKETAASETEAADSTAENTSRASRAVMLHNMQHPRQNAEAQDKFDSMLTKASQELNPTAADETEAETEIIDEPALEQEKPFILEEETQETDMQEETQKSTAETEIKPQEESKPTAQAAVQKTTKAPVTDQRPQQEISKSDETLLGMTQQKQPEAIQETASSEPAQPAQPQQPQAVEQAEQIKTQVIKNLETQRTEFQMQLHPEELGKVNVKMVLEGGKLTVEIMAANPRSAEMLSRQADALAMSLKAGNIETTTVNVVAAPENLSSQMNGQFDLNSFQNRFKNQDNPDRHGKTGNARGAREQGGAAGQINFEKPQAPHRILNYSV